MLVRGRAGIGKAALVRHSFAAAKSSGIACLLVDGRGTKQMLLSIMEQLHGLLGLVIPSDTLGPKLKARARLRGGLEWRNLARTVSRITVMESGNIIIATLRKAPVAVFIEALEVSPQKADLFARMMKVAVMVAGMDERNKRVRISKMLWQFHTVIELKPLPVETCEQIARAWLEKRPIRFSDERTRKRFIRHVAQTSGGVPAAISGLLETAAQEEEITPAKARMFTHEAGITYMDMTPLIVVGVVIAMAGRYVSRGIGEVEMLVFSGVATALFMGLRFFMWQLRAR